MSGTSNTTAGKRGGRRPKLGEADLMVLRRIGLEHPMETLDELGARLARETGVTVSWLTLMRSLRKVGLVRQRPTRRGDADATTPKEAPAPVAKRYGYQSVGRLVDGQLGLFEPQPSGFVLLPRRWVIERTNSWNDKPRRLNKDHDRRTDVSAAWIWLTEARLLLRRLADTSIAATA